MILIIDLENTCMHEDERPAGYHGQIIEIGAAWVTLEGVVIDTFEAFVQAENPVTAFCTGLTGITQKDVDTGLPFPEAMNALAEFAQKHPGETWGSWGNADINSLNYDCAHHNVESPLKGWTHRNLKKEWSTPRREIIREKYGGKAKQAGMARALEIAGIPLEGTHHRALSDVLNIAKLLPGCARLEAGRGVGSDFDEFLAEQGLLEEVEAEAYKRVQAEKGNPHDPKTETEFQRILREKAENQKKHIEAIRAMTPEQQETAMEELKSSLRGDGVPPRKKMAAPKLPKKETEYQKLLREKKESQKKEIETLRNATPEQREIALEALKKALRGDGVKPLPKLPRPKYNFDY